MIGRQRPYRRLLVSEAAGLVCLTPKLIAMAKLAQKNGPMGHFAWWDMSQPLVNTSVMDDSKF